MTLTKAFRSSVTALKKNWWLIIILFVLQLAFVALISLINVVYQTAIAQHMNTIINAVQGANFDENAIKAGMPFVADAGAVYAAIDGIVSNLWKLVGYQALVCLTLGILMWALTHYMLKKQNILKLFIRLFARSAVFFAVIGAAVYGIIQKVLANAAEAETFSATTWVYAAAAVFIIGSYFMFVSLALGELGFIEGMKKTFVLGVKNIPSMLIGAILFLFLYLMPLTESLFLAVIISIFLSFVIALLIKNYISAVLLFNILLFSGTGYLLFLFADGAFVLLAFFAILFLLGLVLGRIAVVAVGREVKDL